MNKLKEIERNGLTFSVNWDYEECPQWQDIAPDLKITIERIDGNSVKLNRIGHRPSHKYLIYWATPTKYSEYFKQDVQLLRDFFSDKLSMIYFRVEAWKAGVKLSDSYIYSCATYNTWNDDKLLNEFDDLFQDLIDDCEYKANEVLQKLAV